MAEFLAIFVQLNELQVALVPRLSSVLVVGNWAKLGLVGAAEGVLLPLSDRPLLFHIVKGLLYIVVRNAVVA